MRNHAHVQIVGRRSGRAGPAWDAWVDGAEGIVRCAPRGLAQSDPASAFFGGQGLVPPFRPAVFHEALAWLRVEPARVLAHGVGPEGPYLALRRLRGIGLRALADAIPLDPDCVEAVVIHLAAELAALHSAGVVYGTLHPDDVLLVDGRARVARLDGAVVDGCGRVGAASLPSVDGDLAGLARVARWMLGDRPFSVLGRRLGPLLEDLAAAEVRARPRSANEVLAELGEPCSAPAAVVPVHPALSAWAGGAWAERLVAQGHPWEVVRRIDSTEPDRWTLAGVAGRLLEGGRGSDSWLALGVLCWQLSERTQGAERDAYRCQAEEARARARAGWHPGARGLAVLLSGADPVVALCETAQPVRAARHARAAGGGGALALVGWYAEDDALVEEGLSEAPARDLDAVRVAASRLLEAAPREAPATAARLALPWAQLEAVRALCAEGDEAEALRLAAAWPEPWSSRARLIVAIAVGEHAEAVAIARLLGTSGAWDATVAAVLIAHGPPADPLRVQARRVARGMARREDLAGLQRSGAQAVARDPNDLVGWSALVCARVAAGEVDRVYGELDGAGVAAGPIPWRIFALELAARGRLEDARVVLFVAGRRFPRDAAIASMDAGLALLDGDVAAGLQAAEHAVAQEPRAPWGWLARSAASTWTGNEGAALLDLAAAARAGAAGRTFRALEACVPVVE